MINRSLPIQPRQCVFGSLDISCHHVIFFLAAMKHFEDNLGPLHILDCGLTILFSLIHVVHQPESLVGICVTFHSLFVQLIFITCGRHVHKFGKYRFITFQFLTDPGHISVEEKYRLIPKSYVDSR
jgi:hypothetical protein